MVDGLIKLNLNTEDEMSKNNQNEIFEKANNVHDNKFEYVKI